MPCVNSFELPVLTLEEEADRRRRIYVASTVFNATWGKTEPIPAFVDALTTVLVDAVLRGDEALEALVKLALGSMMGQTTFLNKPWQYIFRLLGV